jgi:hypothetical protein
MFNEHKDRRIFAALTSIFASSLPKSSPVLGNIQWMPRRIIIDNLISPTAIRRIVWLPKTIVVTRYTISIGHVTPRASRNWPK